MPPPIWKNPIVVSFVALDTIRQATSYIRCRCGRCEYFRFRCDAISRKKYCPSSNFPNRGDDRQISFSRRQHPRIFRVNLIKLSSLPESKARYINSCGKSVAASFRIRPFFELNTFEPPHRFFFGMQVSVTRFMWRSSKACSSCGGQSGNA